MLFSAVSVALLGLVSSAVAQTEHFDVITEPKQGVTLKSGPNSTFDIVWQPNNVAGTITITLIEGTSASNLTKGAVLASGVNNLDGKFTWSPVPFGDQAAYGLNITLDGKTQYQLSNGFHIKPSDGEPSDEEPTDGEPTGEEPGKESTTRTTTTVKTTTTVSIGPGPGPSDVKNTNTTTSKVVPPVTRSLPPITRSLPPVVQPSLPPATNYTVGPPPVVTATPPAPVTPTVTPNPIPSTPAGSGASANFASVGLAVVGGLLVALL